MSVSNACSPLVNIDRFDDSLDKTKFNGTVVGDLSGLAVDPGGRIAALADRSSLFTLDARTKKPTSVVHLADENGKALDSEALVIDHDGTFLITSETEPSIRRYSRDGKLLEKSLPVPDGLRVAPTGRATVNQTFEGLALQPGGRTLVASMENALSGDDSDLVRFQTWRRASAAQGFRLAAQYGYQIDKGLGVAEITATGDGRLLVLERGVQGTTPLVRLYLADPGQASDVSRVQNLTAQSGARLIHKTLLADLGKCPSLGATSKIPGNPTPLLDNIEGMTITGHAPGDRLRLLLVSDDNENPFEVTRLYSLTVGLYRR
jgi:hypothetical protein